MDIHEAFRGGEGGGGHADLGGLAKPDLGGMAKPDHRPINPPGPVPGRPHWRWPPYGPPAYIGYEYINPWRYDGDTIIQPVETVVAAPPPPKPDNIKYILMIIIVMLVIIGFLVIRKK